MFNFKQNLPLPVWFENRSVLFKVLLVVILFFSERVIAQTIPPEADVQYKKGCAALELGSAKTDFEIAAAAFEKAVSMAPNWPEPHYKLGVVYDRLDKFQSALDHLKRYLQLAPANAPDRKAAEDLMYKVDFKLTKASKTAEVEQLLANGKWERNLSGCGGGIVGVHDIIHEGNNWWVEAKQYRENVPYNFSQRVPMTISADGFSFTYENTRCPTVGKYNYCMETVKVNAKLISQEPLTYQVTQTVIVQSSGYTSTCNYQWKFIR